MNEKIVGIMGGMGPGATVDLMQRIIRLTPANDDNDHIRCLVDNNPKVPSRIRAIIEKNGEDPGPCLAEMAKGLERSGADFLAIACNTAHHYYEVISKAVDIPVLNIIDTVLTAIQSEHASSRTIGILASPAIRITKLYEGKFGPAGMDIVYPDSRSQELLLNVIKEVKAGRISADIQKTYTQICDGLREIDVDLAIVACTELSILDCNSSLKTVDAAEMLAREIVNMSLARCLIQDSTPG